MRFKKNNKLELFIPDGTDETKAFFRTTRLCIAAHQDDIEIMAYSAISDCYGKDDEWFTGVVVTDGAGSPRTGIYEKYSDDEMRAVRIREQKAAAAAGDYAAQFFLNFTSSEIKNGTDGRSVESIAEVISACAPEIVYTHNLADKHDTHVAVALRTIAAIRSLPKDQRPKKVYSMEVWRGLDWLCETDKVCLDTSAHPNLATALIGIFDSQISGGKRYDSAAIGRRLANATFFESHETDQSESISYAMDITDLVNGEGDSGTFISEQIERFRKEVLDRIARYM